MLFFADINLLPWGDRVQNLLHSLTLLWQGLLAILIVITIVFLVTSLMTHISTKDKKPQDNKGDTQDKNEKN